MPDPIRLVYSKDYALDIGSHVFPTLKYNLIKDRLQKQSAFKGRLRFVPPAPARDESVLLVHDAGYLRKLKDGALTDEEIIRLEMPFSKELVRASLLCCGGTILASDIALGGKLGIHIGGGFHHAFPGHGEGFCVLNDIAVAARRAVRTKRVKKALIIDCDLHQGNGTAAIFKDDPDVFTFSIHQENNYPFFKPKSNLDIGLRDRATDGEYMAALEASIPKIISDFQPELVIYAAGADPYKDDRIGGLSLTREGLRRRDEFVYNQAKNFAVPIAVVLAGGYAYNKEDTAEIHYNTIEAGLKIFYGK
jgi:acetoin utilization deacetylase AcuC-like enzyme